MNRTHDIDRVELARENFLTVGQLPVDAVSGVVSASWRRSRDAGVNDVANVLDRGYVGDIDLQTRFVHCAQPVIDRLAQELSDIPVSILLTDQNSRVLIRRDNQRGLGGRFDNVFLAPGFSYAEEAVGTNGIGTALASGRAIFIRGPEHFAENITIFACAGAPVRDPLTGSVQGVLDLSCLAKDASTFMHSLAQQAARNIEAALQASGSVRQRAVLDRFLRVSRNARGPVLSLAGDVFMSDTRANEELSPQEKAFLREIATGLAGVRESMMLDVELPTGRRARVRPDPVLAGGDVVGVVLRVDLSAREPATRTTPRPTGMPEVPGASSVWRAVCGEVLAAARTGTAVVVTGEPGVGKLSVIAAAHRRAHPGRPLVVMDCRTPDTVTRLRNLPDADRQPTIVLTHLDELPANRLDDLDDWLESRPPGGWLAATVANTVTAVDDLRAGAAAAANIGTAQDDRHDVQVPAAKTGAGVDDQRATMAAGAVVGERLVPMAAVANTAAAVDGSHVGAVGAAETGAAEDDRVAGVEISAREGARQGDLDAVLRHFGAGVSVPALRYRIDDLRQLVPHLLRVLAPRRTVECSPAVLRVLLGYEWPGNVAELRDALRVALGRRPAGDLRESDLPETCFGSANRSLTPIEAAERTAIVRALVQTGGNRREAARHLGIARSSLYRKIQAYGIRPAN
ncbi:sigma-54-dependent Fis family transcriptional regulator [Nocardia sp. NPDC088792]|uniref:sigma-54-dependent Fis family transcriptional regulator n=1 Tax=Nocardia sp. NPDC088792 TaxID=3364332 RepID=UPI0037FF220D